MNGDVTVADVIRGLRKLHMEKDVGIGGLFFRARDPKALGRWHEQHLGITLTPGNYEDLRGSRPVAPRSSNPFR